MIRSPAFSASGFSRRSSLALAGAVGSLLVVLYAIHRTKLLADLTSTNFLPHSFCYLRQPALIWTHVTADSIIAISYLLISCSLGYLVIRARKDLPFSWMLLAFGCFIVACGATHFIEVVTVWIPVYVLAAVVKVLTAAVSLATAAALPALIPKVLAVLQQAKASEMAFAKLREADLRIRAITHTAPDAIFSTNSTGAIRYCNPAAEHLTGYHSQELLELNAWELIPERFRNAYHEQLERTLNRGFRGVLRSGSESLVLTKAGRELPVSVSISCWESDGEPFFTTVLQDLTARKNAEVQFEALLESAPDAMVIIDGYGEITLVNSQTERLFAWSRRDLLGKTIEVLMPARFRGRHQDHRRGFAREPRVRPMGTGLELFGLKKDGSEFPVEISLSPLQIAGAQFVTAAIRDITDRRQAEKAIRELNSELKLKVAELATSSREMEAFSYSVSHDLRAPLRQIDGFSKILMGASPRLTRNEQECLQHIRAGTRHMAELIDSLLNFSRLGKQEVRRELVDLRVIVESVVNEFSTESVSRSIRWHIRELPVTRGDKALLRIAVWNLVSNAVKFTRNTPEAAIEIGSERVNGTEALYVRDNGVGFDMQYADKLFGVFQRFHVQEEFEGTGVGLANVQRIVHKHGGKIWAEAAPQSGATFYFTLDTESGTLPAEGATGERLR